MLDETIGIGATFHAKATGRVGLGLRVMSGLLGSTDTTRTLLLLRCRSKVAIGPGCSTHIDGG